MKQSLLNPKPIICAPSGAAILMGKVIRGFLQNETIEERVKRYESFKNKQERMTRQQRELYKNLLKELEGENNNQVKLMLVGGYRSFGRKYVIQTLKCELDTISTEAL